MWSNQPPETAQCETRISEPGELVRCTRAAGVGGWNRDRRTNPPPRKWKGGSKFWKKPSVLDEPLIKKFGCQFFGTKLTSRHGPTVDQTVQRLLPRHIITVDIRWHRTKRVQETQLHGPNLTTNWTKAEFSTKVPRLYNEISRFLDVFWCIFGGSLNLPAFFGDWYETEAGDHLQSFGDNQITSKKWSATNSVKPTVYSFWPKKGKLTEFTKQPLWCWNDTGWMPSTADGCPSLLPQTEVARHQVAWLQHIHHIKKNKKSSISLGKSTKHLSFSWLCLTKQKLHQATIPSSTVLFVM